MIVFIEIIYSLCKQDEESVNKTDDHVQQSRIDTQAPEPNNNQLEKMYLASASHDETIKVWDLGTSTCLKTLKGHDDCVTSIQFLGKGLMASSSYDSTIKFWDLYNRISSRLT